MAPTGKVQFGNGYSYEVVNGKTVYYKGKQKIEKSVFLANTGASEKNGKIVANNAKNTTFIASNGKKYTIIGVVQGSKRGHLVVRDEKGNKAYASSANHTLLSESYVKNCLHYDTSKNNVKGAKGESYAVIPQDPKAKKNPFGRIYAVNKFGKRVVLGKNKDGTYVPLDEGYARATEYVHEMKSEISKAKTAKNKKRQQQLENELKASSSYTNKNVTRYKGKEGKVWYIDNKTGKPLNLASKEAKAIIADLDDAASGYLGFIGTKDGKLKRANAGIQDPAVLKKINEHYSKDSTYKKKSDPKTGKYKSAYEAFLASEIKDHEVYGFNLDLVANGAIQSRERKQEIFYTNLTEYGDKAENRNATMRTIQTREELNDLTEGVTYTDRRGKKQTRQGLRQYNASKGIKSQNSETPIEALTRAKTKDNPQEVYLAMQNLTEGKPELFTEDESTNIMGRAGAKMLTSGNSDNVKKALVNHDKGYYAALNKYSGGKLEKHASKLDLMLADYKKFSNAEIADVVVQELNNARLAAKQYTARSENDNPYADARTAGFSSMSGSHYSYEKNEHISNAYALIKNPEILAMVEKKCPWFKSVAMNKTYPKNATNEDKIFYNTILNDPKRDFSTMNLISNSPKLKLSAEEVQQNKAYVEYLKQLYKVLENDHDMTLASEGWKQKMVSSLRSDMFTGTTKEDVARRQQEYQAVLKKLDAAAEGKLVDRNGKPVKFEDAVKQYSGMNLAEVNQAYSTHQQYGEIALDLSVAAVTMPIGGGIGGGISTAAKLGKGAKLATTAITTGAVAGGGQLILDESDIATSLAGNTFDRRALAKDKAVMTAEFGTLGTGVGGAAGIVSNKVATTASTIGKARAGVAAVQVTGLAADVGVGMGITEMNGGEAVEFLHDPLALGMMIVAHGHSALSSTKSIPQLRAQALTKSHQLALAKEYNTGMLGRDDIAHLQDPNMTINEAKNYLSNSEKFNQNGKTGVRFEEGHNQLVVVDENGTYTFKFGKDGKATGYSKAKPQDYGLTLQQSRELQNYAKEGKADPILANNAVERAKVVESQKVHQKLDGKTFDDILKPIYGKAHFEIHTLDGGERLIKIKSSSGKFDIYEFAPDGKIKRFSRGISENDFAKTYAGFKDAKIAHYRPRNGRLGMNAIVPDDPTPGVAEHIRPEDVSNGETFNFADDNVIIIPPDSNPIPAPTPEPAPAGPITTRKATWFRKGISNLEVTKDANGQVMEKTYDSKKLGSVKENYQDGRISERISEKNGVRVVEYFNAKGKRTSVSVEANGVVTTDIFSKGKRTQRVVDSQEKQVKEEYHDNGRLAKQTVYEGSSVKIEHYDKNGNLIKTEIPENGRIISKEFHDNLTIENDSSSDIDIYTYHPKDGNPIKVNYADGDQITLIRGENDIAVYKYDPSSDRYLRPVDDTGRYVRDDGSVCEAKYNFKKKQFTFEHPDKKVKPLELKPKSSIKNPDRKGVITRNADIPSAAPTAEHPEGTSTTSSGHKGLKRTTGVLLGGLVLAGAVGPNIEEIEEMLGITTDEEGNVTEEPIEEVEEEVDVEEVDEQDNTIGDIEDLTGDGEEGSGESEGTALTDNGGTSSPSEGTSENGEGEVKPPENNNSDNEENLWEDMEDVDIVATAEVKPNTEVSRTSLQTDDDDDDDDDLDDDVVDVRAKQADSVIEDNPIQNNPTEDVALVDQIEVAGTPIMVNIAQTVTANEGQPPIDTTARPEITQPLIVELTKRIQTAESEEEIQKIVEEISQYQDFPKAKMLVEACEDKLDEIEERKETNDVIIRDLNPFGDLTYSEEADKKRRENPDNPFWA